jgi:hypothetical protein
MISGAASGMRDQRAWAIRRKVRYSGEWMAPSGPMPKSAGTSKAQPAASAPAVSRATRSGTSGLGRMRPFAMKCFGSCTRWRGSR